MRARVLSMASHAPRKAVQNSTSEKARPVICALVLILGLAIGAACWVGIIAFARWLL